jgi:hypothetical protein
MGIVRPTDLPIDSRPIRLLFLKLVDRRIITVTIIANLSVRHGLPHRAGLRHGIASEIDHFPTSPSLNGRSRNAITRCIVMRGSHRISDRARTLLRANPRASLLGKTSASQHRSAHPRRFVAAPNAMSPVRCRRSLPPIAAIDRFTAAGGDASTTLDCRGGAHGQ